MIKVCMVGYSYDYDCRINRYIDSLKESGNKADILCLQNPVGKELKYLNDSNVYKISTPRFPKNKLGYIFEYGFSFLSFSLQLIKLFLKYRYDVIHIHNIPDFLIFTAIIPKILGDKLILDVDDPMPEVYMSKYGSKK